MTPRSVDRVDAGASWRSPRGGGGLRFVRVADLADLPPDTMLDVEVGGAVVLLVNAGGTVYAVSAWCPHLGTALALGRLSDTTLTCFAHLWTFDLRTGTPLWPPMARAAPGYALRTHRVRIEGSEIFVEI